jgi:hypothetical protein
MQARGVDVGRGRGRHWRGQGRQEETPSNSRLGAREGVAVNRVRRGGTDDQKKNPTRSHLKRGVGVGGTRQRGWQESTVSCKFHVTLFGCRVGGDVGQLCATLGVTYKICIPQPTNPNDFWVEMYRTG